MMTGSIVFAGCGKKDSGSLTDKLQEKTEAGQEAEGKEKPADKKEKKKEGRFEKSDEVPVLLHHMGSQTEHNDAGQIAIDHHYNYLTLDKSYASSHKELDSALLAAKDQILTDEKRKRKAEIDSIQENELYSYEENWDTCVRRADNNILSFVTEYVAVGEFDGQYYTEYKAHNFYTESGEEIELKDIVSDEDAFFDILASKLNEYFYYAKKNIYCIDADADDEQIKKDVKDYLDQGLCTWTLDPYGVTFYLNAYTGLPEGVSATVLFSDDEEGNIFNEDFVLDARDEWVMQAPMHVGTYVDLDDDGKTEFFIAHTTTDMGENEGPEYYYISGLYISADGWDKSFKTSMPEGTSDYDIYLLHKKGKTVVFECHDEYGTGFITSYVLGEGVTEADAVRGVFEWSEDDYDRGTDIVIPHYVPLEADNIRVLMEEDNEARDMTPDILSIDENGIMELKSGDFEHYVKSEDDGSVQVDVGRELSPFYGVWAGAFEDRQAAVELYNELNGKGFAGVYVYSVEWENLSKDPYFCVSAGMCRSEEEANALLEDVKKAGYKDAYVKFTGERIAHRIYYVVNDESAIDLMSGEVILNDVQIEEMSGGYGGKASLTVNKDTVFDETCDMSGFGNLKKGASVLDWFEENMKLLEEDPDEYLAKGAALKGVFDVSITGNHIDAFYGSYWVD